MKRRGERAREWDAESLYAYGLRFLTFRARSEREIRQRFQQRGAPVELIESTLERLRQGGLVDDEAFARTWVDSRRRASPRGDRLLQRELFQKGVGRHVVETTLAEADVDAAELARVAAAKRARALASEPEPVFVRRLTDFLLRRGFDYETSAGVVRELLRARDQA